MRSAYKADNTIKNTFYFKTLTNALDYVTMYVIGYLYIPTLKYTLRNFLDII